MEQENQQLKLIVTNYETTTENLKQDNAKLREKLDGNYLYIIYILTRYMSSKYWLFYVTGNERFDCLFKRFHSAFYNYNRNGGKDLFKPKEMEAFCKTAAPGLFEVILESIVNNENHEPSKARVEKQKKRVVSLLHSMSYFRDQVNIINHNSQNLNFTDMCSFMSTFFPPAENEFPSKIQWFTFEAKWN